ncbi:limonene-1,2-epoxide hydrolase family protein [Gordonia sp. LSe1-13]|uniref:Limonene-1,2-epoxide hydrolase family protein n=1 Tax=Gordonia sesuvii TaxID=3116777 RepID=A0ABU7M7H5_9ACTN|nr:limonene-1,2-epoxide hydrolase family protein [Gordonia sp. LSe1-13]
MTSQTPTEIVTRLLDGFARDDVSGALESVADDIEYTNVSMPTVHGKRAVAKIFRRVEKASWMGFNYRMINVAEEGSVVLTERIDELRLGPIMLQFWVCGRFEIRDAQIVVWRDYFDYFDMAKGFAKGVVALVVPRAVTPLPEPAVAA